MQVRAEDGPTYTAKDWDRAKTALEKRNGDQRLAITDEELDSVNLVHGVGLAKQLAEERQREVNQTAAFERAKRGEPEIVPTATLAPANDAFQIVQRDTRDLLLAICNDDKRLADRKGEKLTDDTLLAAAAEAFPLAAAPLGLVLRVMEKVWTAKTETGVRLNAVERMQGTFATAAQRDAINNELSEVHQRSKTHDAQIADLGRHWTALRDLRSTLEDHIEEELKATRTALRAEIRLEVRTEVRASFAAEFEALRSEIKTLRERPDVVYCGVYKSGERYHAGNITTKNGGMWLCLQTTTSTPGTDPESWRLVVKEGRAQ